MNFPLPSTPKGRKGTKGTATKSEVGGPHPIRSFLQRVAAQFSQTLDPCSFEYHTLQGMADTLQGEIRQQRLLSPRTLPAVRHWETALTTMGLGPVADLQEALRVWTPALHWIQSPAYQAGVCSAKFFNNYACTELVGPHGFCPSEAAILGLMLLGPDTYYPPHNHPSAESLYVMAGRGTWHLDRGPTISLPPGAAAYIPHGRTHAFWSMETPLLALYICVGDVSAPPQITDT